MTSGNMKVTRVRMHREVSYRPAIRHSAFETEVHIRSVA